MKKRRNQNSLAPGEPDKTEDDFYYDAMELLSAGHVTEAKRLLLKAVEKSPHSVQSFIGLTAVYEATGDVGKTRECTDLAFRLTQAKFRPWPKRMLWGILENRKYLRAIANRAMFYHQDGENERAEKLYRLLLKLNPHDNQGIRFLLAGLYAKISPQTVDNYVEEGNRKQNWSKVDRLLATQNGKRRFWKAPRE